MGKRSYLILFLLGLIVAIAGAYLQSNPGYMDAYYYFYSGQQIVGGSGFNEMLIWNYLDDPTGMPHPSHSYWMPATSLMSALGLWLFSGFLPEFKAAQVIFLLLVAFIPPVTAALVFKLKGKRQFAWLAGALAAFTGSHQPYLTTTDSFALVMLIGGCFFLAYVSDWRSLKVKGLILGGFAGLMHLTRVDGILWLGLAGLGILYDLQSENEGQSPRTNLARIFSKDFLILGLVVVGGYLLIMAPWFIRNLNVFGSLFAPGGGRALWVRDYDELFTYPASILTPNYLLAAGWESILTGRAAALWGNLKGTWLAMGMLFPGLLAMVGFWQWRREKFVRLGLIGILLLYLALSLFFPFSGVRGSYLHSGAAFVPFILAVAMRGFDALLNGLLRIFKHWEDARIRPLLSALLIALMVGYSGLGYYFRVIDSEPFPAIKWNLPEVKYAAVDQYIQSQGAGEDDIVICTNPPAFVTISGKPSVGMPDGGLEVLLAVIRDFNADWVMIEENHTQELTELYESPQSYGDLIYMATIEDIVVFRWKGD